MSQIDYCKANIGTRLVNFPKEYPCGDKIYQEILQINELWFIFTESYCVKTSDMKFEVCTKLEKDEVKIVLCFYNVVKNDTDILKYREMAMRIFKTLKITET